MYDIPTKKSRFEQSIIGITVMAWGSIHLGPFGNLSLSGIPSWAESELGRSSEPAPGFGLLLGSSEFRVRVLWAWGLGL